MTRTLLLHGGWPGHQPALVADWAERTILRGHEVDRHDTLEPLDPVTLSTYDLLVPLWTYGTLTGDQSAALDAAVRAGLGLVAMHGHASAFLGDRAHKHLLGGQFVAHPGGGHTTHTVRFGTDPLVADLDEVTLTTEQYYLLVDPAVQVLASTTMVAPDEPWLAGVDMPVAWTRAWGDGRVFYCSVGHDVAVLDVPQITELFRRGAAWAGREAARP